MNLNDYQSQAEKFAVFPEKHALTYPTLGLANEAGEFAGKVKKILRGDYGNLPEHDEMLAAELGDVLWYLAACASAIGYDLEEIAVANLAKLEDRQNRGVIKGSGDTR